MKIFCAVLATETNTFSPVCIDRRAFEASLYAPPGSHPETPTLCSAPLTVGRAFCARYGWTLVEGTAAWADPAGLVNRETYEGLRDEILDQLRAALPVDGVVLGIHGAMVASGYDDPEGNFLSRIRDIVGPDILVCAEFDPHSHLTAKRVEAADFLIAFKEFPHTDFVAEAENLWSLARKTLLGQVQPVMSVHDCRMIDVFPTSHEPMRSIVAGMRKREETDPDVLSISIVHGFMAGDVPEMGTRVLVVTDDQPAKGARIARQIGEELYRQRGNFMPRQLGAQEALDRAVSKGSGPVVIADMWDNPGGGTAGDSTVLLELARRKNLTNIAFGSIWDPVAVQICHAAGAGAEIPLRFGAKSAPGTGMPIDARVTVLRTVRQAEIRFGDSLVPIGDAAAIRMDGIEVVLNSVRAQCFDPTMFSVVGITPQDKDVLVVKSTNHFHASFSPIARDILYCSAGSPYPNDPRRTMYEKARRDIWPICADTAR